MLAPVVVITCASDPNACATVEERRFSAA